MRLPHFANNRLSLIACRLSLAALLVACSTDSYDAGQGTYSLTTADFVEAHTNGQGRIDYALTDNGDTLTLAPTTSASWAARPDTLYRALLYYNKPSGNVAQPVALSQVGVLNVLPRGNFAEVSTDPVNFESLWLGKNGKYINLGIYIKVGETADTLLQSIGMMGDSLTIDGHGRLTAHLTLYHNQNNMPEYYSDKYYLSIPTQQLLADTVAITINTYDGRITKRIALTQ